MRTTIVCILACFFCQGAVAERGYDKFRKLRIQANLYESLNRLERAGETLLEAYEAFPDEAALLDAAQRFERAKNHQKALLTLEKYFSVSRSPAGRAAARSALRRVRAEMDKTSAEIRISTTPKDAEVCIGQGHDSCQTAPVRTWLTQGEHTIRVHAPGLASRTYKAKIDAQKHQRIRITLQPHVPAGRIEVFARVDGAPVTLNGEHVGKTPMTAFSLPAGRHRISIALTSDTTWADFITVEPGRTTTVYAGTAIPEDYGIDTESNGQNRLQETTPVIVEPLTIPEPKLTAPLPKRPMDIATAGTALGTTGTITASGESPASTEPTGSGVGRGGSPQVAIALPQMTRPEIALSSAPPTGETSAPAEALPMPTEPEPVEVVPVQPESPPSEVVTAPEPDPAPITPAAQPNDEPTPETQPIAELPVETLPEEEQQPVQPSSPELGAESATGSAATIPESAKAEEPAPATPEDTADPKTEESSAPGIESVARVPATRPESAGEPDHSIVHQQPPNWMPITGWTTLGVGLGALGGAVATSFLTSQKVDDIRALYDRPDSTNAERDALRTEAEELQLVTNILYPVGGAFVAAGITLLVLDMMSKPDEPSLGDTMQLGAVPLRDGGMLLQTTIAF